MARISYVDPASVDDPELAEHLERARRRGVPRPESQAVRAHVPAVLRAFSRAWEDTFHDGVVDHALKELCRLYVSRTVDCAYCGSQRSGSLGQPVLADDAVADLVRFEDSERFDEREKAALAYTDAIAWDPDRADDALWQRLHGCFTEAELVELGFFVALTLGQQRWIRTLSLDHSELPADAGAGLAAR